MTRDGDGLTRRKVLVLSAGAITATAFACARPDAACAAEDGEVHGISGFDMRLSPAPSPQGRGPQPRLWNRLTHKLGADFVPDLVTKADRCDY
jgi:hypothetical protein